MSSMFSTFTKRVAVPAALVFATVTPLQAQTTLRWKFKEGDVLKYEFSQKNEIKAKVDQQDFASKNDLAVTITWKVKSVSPDGSADVDMRLTRAVVDAEGGGQKIHYDSDSKDSFEGAGKPFHDIYAAAIGEEYKLKIDSRGQVLEAKIPDKVTSALQVSPFAAAADSGSFMSEKGVKNVLAQVAPALPEKPVSKGATWSGSIELPVQPLKLTLNHEDTLTDLNEKTAKIDSVIKTTIIPDPNSPIVPDMKKQEGTGTMTIDTEKGRIVSSSIVQTLNLGLKIMERSIDQTISINARLKLLP